MVMNICIGSAYAWSVFQTPLVVHLNATTTQVSFAFTICLALSPVTMLSFGRFLDKKGPQKVAMLGSVLFSIGMFLVSYTNSIPMLYVTYSILGGIGGGAVYASTISNTIKWFPDKRGLSGGLVVAGYGLGAMIFAPLAASLIEIYGVLATFRIMGFAFFFVIGACSILMKSPLPDYKPDGWEPSKITSKVSINSGLDLTPNEMLKTNTFYILWVMYIIGALSGLMIIGHASPIAQEQIGLTPSVSAICVSIIALSNTFGRILWGSVSDRIGRYYTIVLMYVVSAPMFLVLNIANNILLFIIATVGIALSFGGFLGIMPSVTADNFGTKNLGINYAFIFTAYGIAAIAGPRIAAVAKETSGGLYANAYIMAFIMNVVGIICAFIMVSRSKKNAQRITIDA